MLIAYEVTKELLGSLREIVQVIERRDRDLGDQLRRAATSVLLNLAEGQKFGNGNRKKHYDIAHGSANEVRAALDAAEAWGWISVRGPERELLDRLLALLWKLTQSAAVVAKQPRRSPASAG